MVAIFYGFGQVVKLRKPFLDIPFVFVAFELDGKVDSVGVCLVFLIGGDGDPDGGDQVIVIHRYLSIKTH